MHLVYLLLGSNLGERLMLMRAASAQIALQVGTIVRKSGIYETAPWGVSDQPVYLNQALLVQTILSAEEVLYTVLAIEKDLGRVREKKWEARLIDIDILFYDEEVKHTPRLQIPHPLLHRRKFVLLPLQEIAPKFKHPLLGYTIDEMLSHLKEDPLAVKRIDELD